MAVAEDSRGASAPERREALKAVWHEARSCERCALAATRTTVVFGAGDADADLMFVGEAPGRHEDAQGLPFVGQAGKLLDSLLGEIGLERADVFIANVLKCRPPGNRDPLPGEIEACAGYLRSQVALIQPRVICTLGNFATKLLRQSPEGISRVHGRVEVRVVAGRAVRLYPVFHPAAALYNRATGIPQLQEDFARLPELLALPPVPQPEAAPPEAGGLEPDPAGRPAAPLAGGGPEPAEAPEPRSPPASGAGGASPSEEQLGLF